VAGASVQFTPFLAVAFSACAGASTCTVLTDGSGTASTFMTVLSAGVMTLTAKLAPAQYPSPQQVQVTLLGVSSQLDLSVFTPSVWIAEGATWSLPVVSRVLSNGTPVAGASVNYRITAGSANLSASASQTDSNGFSSVNLNVNSLAAGIQMSICVAPSSACQIFSATMVPLASLQVQPVNGTLQIAKSGQAFQPVIVRVSDSGSPPHAVLGASVTFLSYAGRLPRNQPIIWTGEAGISQPGMPVILAKAQATVQSDINGLASFPLSTAGLSGNIAIVGSAIAGNSSLQFVAQQLGP